MPKTRTMKEVYEELAAKGFYEEAHLDREEVKTVLAMIQEDFAFARRWKQDKKPSWRVIFNAYYDVFRELCDQLMRFKGQKTSNHQGVFAFLILHFPELELDWELVERIRTLRNENKYRGVDISETMWKSIEWTFESYISAVQKRVEELLQHEA
ncbi:MAG: hypothetical protein AABX13_06420 [Nanoarchaeota archaeon]